MDKSVAEMYEEQMALDTPGNRLVEDMASKASAAMTRAINNNLKYDPNAPLPINFFKAPECGYCNEKINQGEINETR